MARLCNVCLPPTSYFREALIDTTSIAIVARIQRHNSNHKGFTGRAKDWVLIYSLSFETKKAALVEEKKIKARGAKRFLDGLSS